MADSDERQNDDANAADSASVGVATDLWLMADWYLVKHDCLYELVSEGWCCGVTCCGVSSLCCRNPTQMNWMMSARRIIEKHRQNFSFCTFRLMCESSYSARAVILVVLLALWWEIGCLHVAVAHNFLWSMLSIMLSVGQYWVWVRWSSEWMVVDWTCIVDGVLWKEYSTWLHWRRPLSWPRSRLAVVPWNCWRPCTHSRTGKSA